MKKLLHLLFILISLPLLSQEHEIDKIVGVVGNNIVMKSELEKQYSQLKAQPQGAGDFTLCSVLEDMLYQKLLIEQAVKDSVEVTDAQVENELDRRFRYYIGMFGGSTAEFEKFYGKTVDQFKDELSSLVKEQMMAQQMQSKITSNITVNPSEVKTFFNSIRPDSIPYINAEVEVGQIVRIPPVNPELKKYAKEKITAIREKITSGKLDFDVAVRSESQDPGSNGQNGTPIKYEHIQRGTFVPEFDAIAFKIKPMEVSEVFETAFGFHILRVLARRGEEVDLQHILITIETAPSDLKKCSQFLDSIANLIQIDSLTFTEAASRFSQDEETQLNGGRITNPNTGNTKFEMDQISTLDPNIVFTLDKLKPGEISRPVPMMTNDAKQAYRIFYLFNRTEPHRANLKDDYQRIQDEALADKRDKIISNWIATKIETYYVKIDDEYKNCNFDNPWLTKNKN